MKKYAGLLIEIAIYVILLYFVWTNSHWSTALTLSMIVLTLQLKLSGPVVRRKVESDT